MLPGCIQNIFTADLIILPFYILVRIYRYKKKKLKGYLIRECVLASFVFFMISLFSLLFYAEKEQCTPSAMYESAVRRLSLTYQINIYPFRNITMFFQDVFSIYFLKNVLGNILLFIPMGFALPLLWKKWQSFLRIFLVAFFFPLFIEMGQLFFSRYIDIDDVFLNLLGILAGYGIYKIVLYLFPKIDTLSI